MRRIVRQIGLTALVCFAGSFAGIAYGQTWSGYGHDGQHTGLSTVAAQPLNNIHWSTPVDLSPTPSGALFVHYGSPSITAANTVLVPVKTGVDGGFEIKAINGATGAVLYTLATDYVLPAHVWVPPYGPALSVSQQATLSPPPRRGARPLLAPRPLRTQERLYYPGAGGTLYYRDQLDTPGVNSGNGATGQIAFYGNSLYAANPTAFNNSVHISTPLVADGAGNVYFGFTAQTPNPANLTSGIARVGPGRPGLSAGTLIGNWISARSTAGGDPSVAGVALNCTPALSIDGTILYFAVSTASEFGTGYLVAVDTATLAPIAHVALQDPRGGAATVSADSSASPTVGPDGDVYYGVLENNCCSTHNDRGWMLHFDSTLKQSKIPGSFGWDTSASIVPARAVASYTGSSPYLILTKYNNYAGQGTGTGNNKVAVLDPDASMADPVSGAAVPVMREVVTILGQTPDTTVSFPNAVREWCINTAAIDPVTNAAIINSEDGTVYRWNFATNTFTQRKQLTGGRGESYTPTVIGVDGTVYAINDAILFAIGN
ncbi:MAG TPA: hypothetical protein VG273_23675 [Bryobacteraceae bacterium]|jgi:hypothetical protein|nr:hypothetical protein [Bryobacteraceae bacterium]